MALFSLDFYRKWRVCGEQQEGWFKYMRLLEGMCIWSKERHVIQVGLTQNEVLTGDSFVL